jgi:hypothetical protein
MEKIGASIGIVEDNFSVTNNSDESVQIRVKFDYSNVSDNEIKSWLNGNRRISFQRPIRALTVEEIKALDGRTIPAGDAGKKMKSAEDMKAEALATLAALKVNFPEMYAKLVSESGEESTEESTEVIEEIAN